MESLLLENLRKNQTFAAAVKKNSRIDQLANQVLRQVMFQPNEGERGKALGGLEEKIVKYFGSEIQPAARAQGLANAKAVMLKLGPPPDLDDPELRRRILIDGDLRPKDRLRIVQAIVNDKANTLDNRLTAYWLEPGRNPREKLETLKALHFEQEKRRLEYERELAKFHAGSESKRPAKPKLDFMSKFVSDVKGGVLEQARRSGTDAETDTFVKHGETEFAWVTVNASEACPDCKKRQGMTGDSRFWDQHGKPGSGHTVCGTSCYCMLVPSRTLNKHPSLQQGLNVPPAPLPPLPPPAALPPPQPIPYNSSHGSGTKHGPTELREEGGGRSQGGLGGVHGADASRGGSVQPEKLRGEQVGRSPREFAASLESHGLTGSGPSHAQDVLRAAKASGDFIPSEQLADITSRINVGGYEHQVYLDPESKRYYKLSRPTRDSLFMLEENAQEYLANLQYQNELAPELDIKVHGVTVNSIGEVQIVHSVNRVEGTRPTRQELADYLNAQGWRYDPMSTTDRFANTWKNPQTGAEMGDAHAGNFIKTASGKMVPIDVHYTPGRRG